MVPRQKLIDPALFVAGDDSGERGAQVGKRLDGIEFACLDQRGDGCPVLSPGIVARKERVLAIESNRPDGSLNATSYSGGPVSHIVAGRVSR
jgi:hypothetical protein